MGTRAGIGVALLLAVGCAPRDESLGCAELVVECPGGAADQQWWLTKDFSSAQDLEVQSGECGSWLAFIRDGAEARYDDVDLGAREGEMRLRVMVAANDDSTAGGTLELYADADPTAVTSCVVMPTGGWFNWLVVDCGVMPLRGRHSLVFKFLGTARYVFNFAAFGVVRSGAPDCRVVGPREG